MNLVRRLHILLFGLFAAAGFAAAQTTAPATAPAGRAEALIIVGAPGTPLFERHYRDRAARFTKVLQAAGVGGERITVLGLESPASAESVTRVLRESTRSLRASDPFILILLGHGAAADGSASLMLNGPDLDMRAVAAELKDLKSRSQVVLNFSAAAGDALAVLAQPGRVNIAGSSPGQVNDNDFAEFFLQELEAEPAPSLLAAFNRASERFGRWIVRQRLNPVESGGGWIVEGSESAGIFRRLYEGGDVPPERRFAASPASEQPDAPSPPLVPEATPHWAQRRVITEWPALDDSGRGTPATALGAQGLSPVVPGKDSPVGATAEKTVLGRTH